jgi:hypothetical protein
MTAAITTVEDQRRMDRRTSAVMYLVVLFVSGVLGVITLSSTPQPFALPLTMLLLATIVVTARPVAGLYLIGFFAFATDTAVSPWYPFTWNLSSRESVLYISNALYISPLEILLIVTMASWLLRIWLDPASPATVRGRLLRPLLVFTAFVAVGFVYGVGTGGQRYAAVWEARPLFYLPILYLLVTNLFTRRSQYRRLLVVIAVALVLNALFAMQYYSTLSDTDRHGLESLVAHTTALQMNVVLFIAIAACLIPRAPTSVRWLVPLAGVPIAWAWLVSQRRAAVVALAAAFILLAALLWKLNRRAIVRAGPIVLLVLVGYLGAFWHSEGTLGFPAQALKAVIAPGQISQTDRDSDLYRTIENFDLSATIHAKPLTGLGFGKPFYRPVALPDISFYPFFEYISHNSILWMWIKVGIGGFVAMLFMIGATIRKGTSELVQLDDGRDMVTVLAGLSFVVMFIVFAYVDIAWDYRDMIGLAFSMALCGDYTRLPTDRSAPRSRVAREQPSSRRPRELSVVS